VTEAGGSFHIRLATLEDVPRLTALIESSVRTLQAEDYSPAQIDAALCMIFGVDTRLIGDGTYFVIEDGATIIGCGGWSRRRTLFGGDQATGREDGLLDPQADAAKIRAFFVHPDWARRGVGSLLLEGCEQAAIKQGFRRFEMGATLTGVRFYRMKGYRELEKIEAPLTPGVTLPIVRMGKQI
jgi:GNAT superfamily N-acetyltransferase